MQPEARAQVGLILANAEDLARLTITERLEALFADHTATGRLQSGVTVKEGVRVLEEETAKFISGVTDQVAPVAKDVEAFAMIRGTVDRFLDAHGRHTERIISMATGKAKDGFGSIGVAASDLWDKSKERLVRQVELQRFAFTVPPNRTGGEQPARAVPLSAPLPKNRGGKPLAAHWDEMWADIAVQLWAGDLQPKTQADIKRAMLDWFAVHEIEVGDTAVTDRARQLWRKIEAAQ